jgi:SMODS domain-containing protein
MPYTVLASFNKFLENISLTGDHKETASARKDRVVSLLSKSFAILDAFATGSIPRGTALRTVADLDVMVVLHWSKHIKDKNPTQVLQDVRDALAEYRTNVRKNGQAVTLHYESWPSVDIVPVSRTTNHDGSVNHYNVPNMNSGRWLQSRPRRHANNIDARASHCGARFKPLIRIIKQWNDAHSDLMESYHIEVLSFKIFDAAISDYPWGVFQFFDGAAKLVQSPLQYEDGFADDYLTDHVNREEVRNRLRAARDRAREAWYLTYEGHDKHEEAIAIWRQIFGEKFPAYG